MNKVYVHFESWILSNYQKFPTFVIGLLVGGGIIMMFLLGRAGIFGEQWQALSVRIIPINVPRFDKPQEAITLVFNVQYLQGGKTERVALNGKYPANSEMIIEAKCSTQCWLMIIGVDMNGPYRLYPNDKQADQAQYFNHPQSPMFTLPVKLDGKKGNTAIIIFSAPSKFSYEKTIKTALSEKLRTYEHGVERAISRPLQIVLPNGFVQQTKYFLTY